MSEPFTGEITMFAGNFAPKGWAYCDGQLLEIAQNEALFSLLGTFYGGDGRSSFCLPDLRGRLPLHQGTGPGLSIRPLGSKAGAENVTLTAEQLASHDHDFVGSTATAATEAPQGMVLAQSTVRYLKKNATAGAIQLNTASIAHTGGGQPHSNLQPSLGINYIIALFGIYPSRN